MTVSKGKSPEEKSTAANLSKPDFVGQSYDKVLAQAKERGLSIKVTEYKYNKDYKKNVIFEQSAAAGSMIKNTQVIELKVSMGYEKIKIPNVKLKDAEQALVLLLGHGLKCKLVYEDSNITKDLVISQSSADTADPETEIELKVSKGVASFSMPRVVGKDEKEENDLLTSNGLVVTKVYEENDKKTEGSVLRQSISEGKNVKSGDEVVITICTHSKVISVPYVIGSSQSDAEKTINSAGLKVNVVKQKSSQVAKGKVISQSPDSGSSLKKDGIVTIYVSEGEEKTSNTTSTQSSASSHTSSNDADNQNSNEEDDTNHQNENNNTTSSKTTSSKTTSSNSITTKTLQSVSATGISLNTTSLTLKVGSTEQLSVSVSPNNATDKTVSWSSSNTKVAAVNNSGVVTAKAEGTATITAKTHNGKTATCKVTVQSNVVQPTSVSLSEKSLNLNEGDSKKLSATVSPSNATKTLTWKSSNTSVAAVDNNGNVTAKDAGSATITVTTQNGKTAQCQVNVYSRIINPTSISLSEGSIKLGEGENTSITAVISPSNATNQSVTWSSNNTSVATVNNNGHISALQQGTAVITAKTFNGLTANCTVTVSSRKRENGAQIASGSCGSSGDNVQWQIFDSGNMYIFGSGNMELFDSWDSYKNRVGNITMEYGVTSICNNAFSEFTELQSITIPEGVTFIGKQAFYKCEKLSEISIPNGVTSIGQLAFCNCTRLSSVTLPNTLTTIEDSAFFDCTSLHNLDLPASVISIGDKAFSNVSLDIYFRGNKPSLVSGNIFGVSGSNDVNMYYPRNNLTWSGIESQINNDGNINYLQYDP